MSKPILEHITITTAEEKSVAKAVVFSTGSRGFRATFKAVINVGSKETPDLRMYQVGANIIEVGSKGQEDYSAFKAAGDAVKAAKLRERADALTSDSAPRLAASKS